MWHLRSRVTPEFILQATAAIVLGARDGVKACSRDPNHFEAKTSTDGTAWRSKMDSNNPARSTGPALFVGGWAMEQLWLFWLAPIVGGVLGGLLYRWVASEAGAVAMATTLAPARAPS